MEMLCVPITSLRERDQWKVEFFLSPKQLRTQFAFKLVPVRELVFERRETMEPSEFPETAFNFVGLEHVEGHTGDLVGFSPVLGAEIRSRSKIFRRNDVLYGRLRPYLNKVFVADGPVTTGVCSGEYHVLSPRLDRIRPKILRALLASGIVQDVIAGLQAGSTHPRLGLDDLLDIELPVPPIDRQTELEEFIAKQDEERRILKARLTQSPSALLNCVQGFVETENSLPTELPVNLDAAAFSTELPLAYRDERTSRKRL